MKGQRSDTQWYEEQRENVLLFNVFSLLTIKLDVCALKKKKNPDI